MEKKFRLISIFFIVGCFIYYGGRFGYYYMKFNKKSSNSASAEVLANTIQKQGIVSKGDGLYNNSGELVFKGTDVDNYLLYSKKCIVSIRHLPDFSKYKYDCPIIFKRKFTKQ